MRVLSVLTLSLGCGFLAAGVSAWNARAGPPTLERQKFLGFLGAASWNEAVQEARERGARLLLLSSTAESNVVSLVRDLREDSQVSAVLQGFVPVVVWLDGPAEDRALGDRLGCTAAPLVLVFSSEAPDPVLVDALEPVTGSSFDRYGLTAELLRVAEGRNSLASLREQVRAVPADEAATVALALRLEAAGKWEEAAQRWQAARESSSEAQGPLVRYERLSRATGSDLASPADGDPGGAADQETELEAKLLVEDDETLLFMGWTRAACRLEAMARSAASSKDGSHLGVPTRRWERRLREATRKAWIACPDELVLAYGALLIERFARAPRDLDSLDRAFMAAVVRSMAEADDADEPFGRAWVAQSRAWLESVNGPAPR